MSKHTPGPWNVCKDSRDCDSVRAKGGFVALGVSIQHYGDPVRFLNEKEEAEANARLIAAAPDLLEACKTALYGGGTIAEAAEKCRAAIAKAEGRE